MTTPLASLNVLDFSTLLPGPFATMFLADLGADVVRIESPHQPDALRFAPPFDGNVSAWHALLNRSKRSMTLDLKKPGASDVVKRLAQTYDIVVEQFRPGVLDRLGIGYEALRAANPRLIYCAITGYGQTGPYRDRAGHDLNYLALSGIASHTGRRDQGPLPLGVQVADVGGGSYNALVGILAAVIHRQQTGAGQFVDISMFDGAVAWNALAASQYFVGGSDPELEGAILNGGSCYDYYRTSDGRYLSVASLEPKFWKGFCEAIDRPDLIELGGLFDPQTQRHLKSEIQRTIASRTCAEWLGVFARIDVCVEPVLRVSEVAQHPQTQIRGIVVSVPKHDGTSQRQIANPIRLSACQPVYHHIGAALGEHTEAVLLEAGYTELEINALQEAGVIGT
jgi:alpha-methylacyl-CoA racemase